ncbi:MAG: sigma-70 family RNA polymerase sigma factor [Propionibacteriales bacterium]|nr:sigma-70 family RNA polymerase sigma factor [Propionibacteriales bacterium]
MSDVISRARAGDEEAFRALTEPHRRELLVHCYRMLGALQDAEDALQDTLIAAWQGLGSFQERASMRTWLYRIATNRCLNALRTTKRRPAAAWAVPGMAPPDPTQFGEATWLEPFPETLLEGAYDLPLGPEARYEQTESISLAFVAALQVLPPLQLAVLVLRDVLGFRAAEVAEMIDRSDESVTSALKRARATLEKSRPALVDHQPAPGTMTEQELVARFVTAYEAADVAGVVALLTDDVFMSMPPVPFEYIGRKPVGEFLELLFGARQFSLVPTRANGQPAFGAYITAPDGVRHASGLITVTFTGSRISELNRFEPSLFNWFGLPPVLPPLRNLHDPVERSSHPDCQ